MGKSLKGKELGKGIRQRKDKRYEARYTNRFGQTISFYFVPFKLGQKVGQPQQERNY